jgi:hypothetical protein
MFTTIYRMPTTRTRTYGTTAVVEKEPLRTGLDFTRKKKVVNFNDNAIDFTRKDKDNDKVTIIKKWGKPDRFLDQYFNTSEKWQALNTYNVLYVLQTKASKEHEVFKIGISSGINYNGGRTETLIMGSPEDKKSCLGIYLWYLAGQKNKINSAISKEAKLNEEIIESYRVNLSWSKKREKFLKDTLKKEFKTIQGYEWFIVPKLQLPRFREIIEDLTNDSLQPDEKTRFPTDRGKKKKVSPQITKQPRKKPLPKKKTKKK